MKMQAYSQYILLGYDNCAKLYGTNCGLNNTRYMQKSEEIGYLS